MANRVRDLKAEAAPTPEPRYNVPTYEVRYTAFISENVAETKVRETQKFRVQAPKSFRASADNSYADNPIHAREDEEKFMNHLRNKYDREIFNDLEDCLRRCARCAKPATTFFGDLFFLYELTGPMADHRIEFMAFSHLVPICSSDVEKSCWRKSNTIKTKDRTQAFGEIFKQYQERKDDRVRDDKFVFQTVRGDTKGLIWCGHCKKTGLFTTDKQIEFWDNHREECRKRREDSKSGFMADLNAATASLAPRIGDTSAEIDASMTPDHTNIAQAGEVAAPALRAFTNEQASVSEARDQSAGQDLQDGIITKEPPVTDENTPKNPSQGTELQPTAPTPRTYARPERKSTVESERPSIKDTAAELAPSPNGQVLATTTTLVSHSPGTDVGAIMSEVPRQSGVDDSQERFKRVVGEQPTQTTIPAVSGPDAGEHPQGSHPTSMASEAGGNTQNAILAASDPDANGHPQGSNTALTAPEAGENTQNAISNTPTPNTDGQQQRKNSAWERPLVNSNPRVGTWVEHVPDDVADPSTLKSRSSTTTERDGGKSNNGGGDGGGAVRASCLNVFRCWRNRRRR